MKATAIARALAPLALTVLGGAAAGAPAHAGALPQPQEPVPRPEPAPDALPELDPEVTAAELEHHVRFLASDELRGRMTGTEDTRRAARYLARAFEAMGLEPGVAEGFLQPVPLFRFQHTDVPLLHVRAGGETRAAAYGVDFTVDVREEPRSTEPLRVVHVTAAEELPEPDAGVAVVLDAPRSEWRAWLEERAIPDARGFGLAVRLGAEAPGEPRERLPRDTGLTRAIEGPDAADWVILQGPLVAAVRAGEVETLALSYRGEAGEIVDFNVVARIAGAGTAERPELAEEAIVLSAHYDHIGTRGEPASEGEDVVFNGADDDASGVAAVLEIAGALAAGEPPARTLLFLLATGEERGLLGTWHYIDRPAVPLERTVLNLNFEMLGRPDALAGGPGKLWLTGFERTTLGAAFRERGFDVVADPRPEQNFFMRSDNIAFVRRGIVGQTLSSYDLHTDYHRVSDEAHLLDYEHMESAVRSALLATRMLAAGELTPAWLEGEPDLGRR